MTQGDQCEQLNLGQHPERSKWWVCVEWQKTTKKIKKLCYRKGGKSRCLISISNMLDFFLRWERLKHVKYSWERASREVKVEDQGLTCKGMVAVGDTGCEAHWSEAHVHAIRMEMRVLTTRNNVIWFSYWEGSSRGIIPRFNWVGVWLKYGYISEQNYYFTNSVKGMLRGGKVFSPSAPCRLI